MSSSKFSVSVLKLRNFRLLLLIRICMTTALQAQSVIVGWQIYSMTKDTFLLGLTGLTEAVPAIACALFAGHVVDVGHPLKIYIACVATIALNTLMFLLFAGGIIHIDPKILLYMIYGGVFLSGLARSFTAPASFTLLSQIVKRDEMVAATAWQGTGFQIAAIGGPALAGLIYGGYGPLGAWILPALLVLAAFMAVTNIRLGTLQRGERRENAIKSIQAGWKFIWTHKVLLSMMTLDMFAVLFGGATAMLPAYADQVLKVGSEGLGALRAAPAIGAVGMTLMLALKPMKHVSAVRLLWVVTGFGICMIGFGASTNFWISIFFLALSGVFDSVSMTIRGTLMQLLTPDHMRGRVSSISSMFIISSNEIGAFESGTAARFLGLVPSVVLGGIGTLIVAGVVSLMSPALRKTVVNTNNSHKT